MGGFQNGNRPFLASCLPNCKTEMNYTPEFKKPMLERMREETRCSARRFVQVPSYGVIRIFEHTSPAGSSENNLR